MSATFTLADTRSLDDLHVFLSRAARVEEGSVRLIAGSGVLAAYCAVFTPAGLLDNVTGATSGEQVMYNPYSATDSSIYLNSGTFTFESVQMTSGWNIKETVTIKGYDESGDEIYSEKVKLTSKGPADVELNWTGVNRVTFFYPEKFKQDPDLLGSGNNVVFDDLVVSKVKGKSGGAELDGHHAVTDGAFGVNTHHESIGSVHQVNDTAHPVNLYLA